MDFGMDNPGRTNAFSEALFGNGEGVVLNGPFSEWNVPSRGNRIRRNINRAGSLIIYDEVQRMLTDNRIRTQEVVAGGGTRLDRTIEGKKLSPKKH